MSSEWEAPLTKEVLRGARLWKRNRTGSKLYQRQEGSFRLLSGPLCGETEGSGETLCLGLKALMLALSLYHLSGPCSWQVGNRGIQKHASRRKWFTLGHSERACLENSDPPGSWTKTIPPPTTHHNFTASKQKALGTCNSEVIMGLVDFLAFLLSSSIS